MPIWIGDGFILASPADVEYVGADPRTLVLDAGQAFGTGTHPTTQMCLLELQRHLSARDHVLDVGTGSGILAIAAARLGAGWVVAIDRSLNACRVARANVSRNGLAHVVAVVAGTPTVVARTAGFDVVVANLDTASEGKHLLSNLSRLCRTGGKIILSGVQAHDEGRALVALRDANLTQLVQRTQGGWSAFVLGKTG